MSNRVWTEAEVRRVYADWRDLSEHARGIAFERERILDYVSNGYWGLDDSSYYRPGEVEESNTTFTLRTGDDIFDYETFPIEYLWSEVWKNDFRALSTASPPPAPPHDATG